MVDDLQIDDIQTRHEVDVDGDTVVAVHHECGGDRWIFFSHGFVSDKEGSYEERCRRAVDERFDAVRFDHRGCGESDLGFDAQNLSTRLTDLAVVVDYFEPESCVLYGSSFGGKVALHAAADDLPPDSASTVPAAVEAVVVKAPVTYVDALERYAGVDGGAAGDGDGYGVGEGFVDDLRGYGFDAVIEALDVPVAVYHGRDDGTVPVRHSFEAMQDLSTDVSLHAYEAEGHRFTRSAEHRMRDSIFRWLEEVLEAE